MKTLLLMSSGACTMMAIILSMQGAYQLAIMNAGVALLNFTLSRE